MNNTDKLITSQYLVKQAMLSKALTALKGFGSGYKGGLKSMLTLGNTDEVFNNVVGKGLDKAKKSLPAGMELPELEKLFGRSARIGGYAGLATPGAGMLATPFFARSSGKRQGAAEAMEKFMQMQEMQKKQQMDKGYFGRLLDAITNQGY